MTLAGVPMGGERRAAAARAKQGGVFASGLHLARRGVASVLAMLVLLATVGIVFTATPATLAGANETFASGQVFASIGGGTVDVYDPNGVPAYSPTNNPLNANVSTVSSVTDGSGATYNTGTAFDANGNLYVADDDAGAISAFSPSGTPLGQFATNMTVTDPKSPFFGGSSNPISLVFDGSGNLYVGQQLTPYIAQFDSSGARQQPDIGPLVTDLYGDDWIDLSSDQCTFYYTSEGDNIMTYNKCTGTQGTFSRPLAGQPAWNNDQYAWNTAPLPGTAAFELKILANGDVLVADSSEDVLLDPNGNVINQYPCSALPNCGGQLFAISVDPSGTSFWTADSSTGNVYQIDIATGAVMKTFATHSGTLYGLSVADQLEVATSPTTVAATPTTLTVQPVTGNFSSPTPVSAVLTDTSTGTPIPGQPVTFTLNGTETCTATTDSTGTATCIIQPGEPSSTYTLTASFAGDSSQSTPIGAGTSSTSFTVNSDTTSATYTGPTSGVNGQPITLTGTLTTNTPTANTPVPTEVVTFTVGSGSTAQSCSGTTDGSGDASCTIPTLNQPTTNVPITTSFGGTPYDTSSSTTTPATVTEPTSLLVNPATSDFADATTVSGVLTDTVTNAPIANEPVTLTLYGNEHCTAMTDATGTASCGLTPSEPAATYTLSGSFGGDAGRPLQLTSASGSANFVVTLEETALAYTGPVTAQNGQPLVLSGTLTTDDPALGTGIGGRTVTLTLGSGTSAQSCSGTTAASGAVACTIGSVNQSPGPIPVTANFAGDAYYRPASAAATVNLPEGTQLTVNPASGTYNGPTTLSGTLVNTSTNQPVPNQPVTFTLNNTQTCTGTTNASGVASCTVTPNEPSGTYSLTGSFPGSSTSVPQLQPTGSSSTATVTQAPTTFTYTGTTSVTNGGSATLSGVLTTNEPSPGTDIAGTPVTLTLGSGSSAQSCTAVTNASGAASCTVTGVNQTTGTTGITASFGGNTYYQSSTAASTATVHTPTTLTVNAGTSDFADAGTVSGTLVNAVTGAPIPGETVTLTLAGTQSCSATTNASGVATCSITPNEPAATYTLTGSFGGDSTKSPQLLASTGSNKYVVTLEETGITYTGPSIAVNATPFTMSANLTTDGNPLAGRAVVMTLGSGTTAQSCNGTTNASGNASCTIAVVNQTSGSVPVTVTFAGDAYYRPASAASTVILAAVADTGGFVIGDISASSPPAPMHPYTKVSNGTQVNFWGSQTWKTNQFSGVNNAPASMKGYIDNAPADLGQPSGYGCGETWTSNPGNSSGPPATLPNDLVVVVSSYINKSGSTESGNIVHVVVVQVAAGYGPAPGHSGWGPIVGWLC